MILFWKNSNFNTFWRALERAQKYDVLNITFFRCSWIYPAGPPEGKCLHSTSLPFDNKCVCAFHSQSICFFDTKLWCCLINLTRSCLKQHHLFKFSEKLLWREKTLKINVFTTIVSKEVSENRFFFVGVFC